MDLFRNVIKELDFIVIKGDTGKLKIRFYVQLHFQIFFKRGFIRKKYDVWNMLVLISYDQV